MNSLEGKWIFVKGCILFACLAFSQVIKDDFQVNEENYPSSFHQISPVVARDSSGNFVLIWSDNRDGDWAIRARLYSATGNPVGSSFRVEQIGKAGSPSVANDYNGNFVVAWEDTRNSNFDIYGQRFNAIGNPQGSNFLVNDDPAPPPEEPPNNQYAPRVGLDKDGDFVITWMDYRNYPGSFGYIDIYGQRYNSAGSPLGSNFIVNNIDSIGCSYPDVAIAPNGRFIITWYDNRNPPASYDIIAQRYNTNGNPIGSNFVVSLFPIGTWQGYPSVAMDARDYFTFTWQDYRAGVTTADIWATRYDNNGNPLTLSGFQVDNDPTGDEQHFPDISAGGVNGRFTIVWDDKRNGHSDVYAQRYAGDGNLIGTNFRINDDATTSAQARPSIGLDFSGAETFVWQDAKNSNRGWDIYARLYDSLGNVLGPSFKINDDSAGAYQNLSDIAYDTLGNLVIVWVDLRNGNNDIFGQRYDKAGNGLGTNFKINDDVGNASQGEPVVAMAYNGGFIVTWKDYRNGGIMPDVYAQRFNASGNPFGANFKVNSTNTNSQTFEIHITAAPTGKFAISWERTKFYNENGDSVGASSLKGSLDSDKNGIYYLVFIGNNLFFDSLFLQKFNSVNGSPIGSSTYLEMSALPLNLSDFEIGCDSVGNFVVTFEDFFLLENGYDIFGHCYDSNGNPIGTKFRVNEDSTGEQTRPRVDMGDDGYFAIAWAHQANSLNPEIYVQKYLPLGSPDGSNFRISNTSLKSQTEPSVGVYDTLIYFCWTDNRLPDHGTDIFAKILGRGVIGIESAYTEQKNIKFTITPNPFRNHLVIKFQSALGGPNPKNFTPLDSKHLTGQANPKSEISIKIYDVSGRLVRQWDYETIRQSDQITWYGDDDAGLRLPAGVYFVHFKAGVYTKVEKAVFLR